MATFKSKLLSMTSMQRKIVLFALDNFICIASFFIAYYLRLDLFLINETQNQIISFLILYFSFVFLCFTFSFYQPLSRYYDSFNIAKIILVFFLYAFLMTLLFNYLMIAGIPRSIGFLHPIIFLIFFISSRVFAYYIISKMTSADKQKNIIVFCDIGSAVSLKNIFRSFNILFFITDNVNFDERQIGSIPIHTLSNLNKSIFKNKRIDFIYLDRNLNTDKNRKKILSQISQKEKISIKVIPKIENFLDFQFTEDIKNIKIFKRKINFSLNKLKIKFKNSSILITGAGGSIGSELCMEILRLEPKNIVLVENSEYNLYRILDDLITLKSESKIKTSINYHLISVVDNKKMTEVFNICKPNYIFHCAAYKHVPLVEKNIAVSVENNFISTFNLCKIAIKNRSSKLILISSDKAVRPSSIMGATKRLSELTIKYFALKSIDNNYKTSFSAVRFANVLNSSGSVVPLFAKQIQAGGPVTITDKKVERYFMTIIDAVKLVLETTLISKSGNIMLLKMGKQIKILEVAKKIANFYGLTIKEKKNSVGDIGIVEIGLRPGEKMREELYYDRKIKKTINKDILCVDNFKLDIVKFEKLYQSIKISIEKNDIDKLKTLLLDQKNMF